jgi:hypothetical protein
VALAIPFPFMDIFSCIFFVQKKVLSGSEAYPWKLPRGDTGMSDSTMKEPLRVTDPRVALRIYLQYLGTLTLLGHALGSSNRPDKMQQERVFTDANLVLRALGSEVRYRPSSNGGWAAFQETPESPVTSKTTKA